MALIWYVLFLQTCSAALGEQPAVPQGALPKDAKIAEPRTQLPFLASAVQGAIPKEPKIVGPPAQAPKIVEPPLVPKDTSLAVAPGNAALQKSSLETADSAHKHKVETDEGDSDEDDDDDNDDDEDSSEERDEEDDAEGNNKEAKRRSQRKRKAKIEEASACREKCGADASCQFKCPNPWEWMPMVKACQDYPAIKACHATCTDCKDYPCHTDCDKCPEFEDEAINDMFAKHPHDAQMMAEKSCPSIEEAHACHQACEPADHECHHDCWSMFHHGGHGIYDEDEEHDINDVSSWLAHHDELEEDEAEETMMMRRKAERKQRKLAEELKQKREAAFLRDFENNKRLAAEAYSLGKDGLELEVSHYVAPKAAPESAPEWLTKIPLLGALMSFAGFLAYSVTFIFKLFRRGKRGQSGAHKATAQQDSEDFENALEMAMESTGCLEPGATPVVRKMAQSQEGSEACTNGWDNDFDVPCEAGCGDAAGGSCVADYEGHATADDEADELPVKGKGD